MESFPHEQLHPGSGWRVRREARTFLGSSYTLVHIRLMGEGNQRGTDDVVREEGEGSPGSPHSSPHSQTPQECNAVT